LTVWGNPIKLDELGVLGAFVDIDKSAQRQQNSQSTTKTTAALPILTKREDEGLPSSSCNQPKTTKRPRADGLAFRL